MKDYYYILGIERNASSEEIKTAHRKLSKKFHPDLNPSDSHSEKMFRDIQEAYEYLIDTEKRKQYDNAYANWTSGKSQASSSPNEDIYSFQTKDKAFTTGAIVVFALLAFFLSQMLIIGTSEEKYSLLIGVVAIVAVNAFMAPFLVAIWKRHTYKWPILAANIILGWTGLGWIACLLFSIYADKK